MTRRWAIGLLLAISAALAFEAIVLWPGVMLPDAIEQYSEALANSYDDWHPPIVAWIWHLLIPVASGPAPMFLLQLALYWTGFALLAASALKRGRRWEAAALAACGLLPIPFGLMASVLKDSLMAGACIAAVGLLAVRDPDRKQIALRTVSVILLVIASATRINAFLATVPLIVALLPARVRVTPLRTAAIAALVAIPLVLSGSVVARLTQASRSNVAFSMVLFDLGGTTERSGIDLLPPMVPDQWQVNHRCYSSLMWDTYSDPCPITFETFLNGAITAHESPYAMWARAVLHHPLAYAEHRLTHFNRNIRWLVPQDIGGVTFIHSDKNKWDYRVRPSVAAFHIYRRALFTSYTPLGWPSFWLAVAGAALIVAPRLPSRRLVVPLALSALLYGGGYLVISVASDLRYHLWTMMAALVVAVLIVADLIRGARVDRWRIRAAATLIAVVLIPAIVWRLFALPLPGGEQQATPKPPHVLTSPTAI